MIPVSCTRTIRHASALALLLAAASPLSAQPVDVPDPARVRIRFGPLLMNPTLSLTNLGIDDNVFNEPVDQSPKRDVTFTVTPTTEMWLRMGPSWLSGTIREDLIWYQTYVSERAANSSYRIGWKLPSNRIVVDAGASYVNERDRPGFEIDARSLRTETKFSGTLEFRALSKTFVGVRADRQQLDFDKDATYFNTNLHDELNHASTSVGALARHQLTPLTAVSFAASHSEDRFDYSTLRDSDSNTVSMSVAFDPQALLKGGATFGYRDFRPRSADVADFRGLTALVDLSYSLLGTTRFTVRAMRDVQYSYEVNEPYYLQTGIDGSVAQQIFGPFDVVARAGLQSLAYRERAGAVVPVSNRVDTVRMFGAGLGYHMGRDLRLGFNIDKTQRVSEISLHQYSGLRFGTSVTYGL